VFLFWQAWSLPATWDMAQVVPGGSGLGSCGWCSTREASSLHLESFYLLAMSIVPRV
jgi:hypothetical protein